MKKLIFIQLVFLFPILLMSTPTPPTMVDGPALGNWRNFMSKGENVNFDGSPINIFLNEYNELHVTLTVTTTTNTNLASFDDLYLSWDFGGPDKEGSYGPIEDTDLVWVETGIYEFNHYLIFDYSTECNNASGGNFDQDIVFGLKTPKEGGGFADYPVAGTPGLFNPSTYVNLSPTVSTNKTLYCWGYFPPSLLSINNDNIENNPIRNTNNAIVDSNFNSSIFSNQALEGVSISPNPFNNEFRLDYILEEASRPQFKLININGK